MKSKAAVFIVVVGLIFLVSGCTPGASEDQIRSTIAGQPNFQTYKEICIAKNWFFGARTLHIKFIYPEIQLREDPYAIVTYKTKNNGLYKAFLNTKGDIFYNIDLSKIQE